LGLFAARNFGANEKVVQYTGSERKIADIENYATTEFPYGVEVPPFLINAVSTQSNNGRYSNTCRKIDMKKKRCKSNNATFSTRYNPSGTKHMVHIKTTEAIPKGSEILTDRPDRRDPWLQRMKKEQGMKKKQGFYNRQFDFL
jgi:hypothetical protein